jgi:hypothetical protein
MMKVHDFKVGDIVRCNCGCSANRAGSAINRFTEIDGKTIAVFSSPEEIVWKYLPLERCEKVTRREPVGNSVEFIAGKIETLIHVRDILGVSPSQHERINATIETLKKALECAYQAEDAEDIFGETLVTLLETLTKAMGK